MYEKLRKLFLRRSRSKKLGFRFSRSRNFKIPKEIKINEVFKPLFIPDFPGIQEVFRDIILDDEYSLSALEVNEIRTIVDVGANIGIFSIGARIFFPDAEIHAYEPNQDNLSHLSLHADSIGFSVYEEAVGFEDGTCGLATSTRHDTSAKMTTGEGSIKVSGLNTILSRFSSDSIDLLKLDCEGSEFQILRDSENLQFFNYISMEYHVSHEKELLTLVKLLDKANFEIVSQEERNEALGNILARRRKA